MQEFYQVYSPGFHLADSKQIWKSYTEDFYRMDRFYRNFHVAYNKALNDPQDWLDDGLKDLADQAENLYQDGYLNDLTACWTNAISKDLDNFGYISEIPKQRDFYKNYISPLCEKNTRSFVIISDAFRFETATELTEVITSMNRGHAELDSMQAVFPSMTKYGMAALLPHKELSVTDDMKVLADGLPTGSTSDREKILNTTSFDSAAIQYGEFLRMKKKERRDFVKEKHVVYIYHNEIDATGDKANTESKVFDACETAILNLNNMVRIIVNDLSGTNIFITADHGFLYTGHPLAENDKIGRQNFSGKIYESALRYVLADPETTLQDLVPVKMDLKGMTLKGYAPRETVRVKIQGGAKIMFTEASVFRK